MSKGVRIQPLIFVKSLGIFVEEVGERGILSNPGYKCAEIHPPLVSKSALLTLLHTFPAQRVIWSLMVPGEWSRAIAEMEMEKRASQEGGRNEWNFILSESKAESQQRGKHIQYWILMKKHTGTSFSTSSLANVSWGTPRSCFCCGRMPFRPSPSESSRVPAHSTKSILEEDAVLGKNRLGCLRKGRCQTLTAINSQERVLWERDKGIRFEKERLFHPPVHLLIMGR